MEINQAKELLNPELENLVNQSKKSLGQVKKVALDEAWRLLQIAVATIVRSIEIKLSDMLGKEKKIVALNLIDTFYDSVFIIVDIPFVPGAIETIIHKYVKQILMIMAGASIDATVTILRDVGVFIKNKKEESR